MARPTAADIANDPRARQLLRTLVSRHIRDGEPVGSQTLARHAGLDVSPATIRNILASLEDAGLLAAPHSSAGRVPTAQGYRLFVDSLLQVKPLGEGEVSRLRSELPAGAGTQALLGNTSELLSAMTHFVGMVSVPGLESFAFRQIEFVALDPQKVLAILVFADGEVQNRVVQVRRAFDPAELEQAANEDEEHRASMVSEEVTSDDIAEVISSWTGIPVGKMLEGDQAKLLAFPDTSLSVTKDAKNKDMAMKFLEYMTSAEAGEIWSTDVKVSSAVNGVNVAYDPIASDINSYLSSGKFTPYGDRVLRSVFTDKLWEDYSKVMLDTETWDQLAADLDTFWVKARDGK